MKEIRTRFAPSPTGYMHIGNLRTAIYEFLVARTLNGKFILRIEDTDQERFVEGAIEVIYNTLKAVGLNYDEGPDIGGPYGPYIQSERKHIYKEYAHKLVELGGAYYCFCSKDRLEKLRIEYEAQGKTFKYDGYCKNLSEADVKKKLSNQESYVIRQKIPEIGQTVFNDLVYGAITVENSQLDEGVLLKSDGMATYNFANVIDDHLMQISHVVRGSEYLSSTPKYNLIYQAFGWETPSYIHLPPIMKTASKKLSKRDGDASFEDFLNKGYLKEAIVNYIVLLGWNPGTDEEFFTMEDLKQRFSIEGLSKAAAILDPVKLKWMNGEYLRRLSLEEFHVLALPHYDSLKQKEIDLRKVSQLLQPRTEVLSDIPEKVDFLESLPEYSAELYVHKKMKTDLSNSLDNLKASKDLLTSLPEWDFQHINEALTALINKMGIKNGQLLWPLRIAVSGKEVTPGGAVEIVELLGKIETIRRIDIGITKLSENNK